MTWTCEKCNGKNNNSSIKCRVNKCHAPKPQSIINAEKEKTKTVRDYCPRCKTHRDFKHIKGKRYSCPSCHKQFKLIGEPIPEDPMIITTLENEIEKQSLKF